jgi:hypothetical protein
VITVLGDSDFHAVEDVADFLRGKMLTGGGRLTKRVIRERADEQEGFSPDRMLVLLHERVRYLLDRGATRNNPHIPERRLLELVPEDQVIEPEAARRAQRLEELVRRELQEIAAATDAATE